MVPMARASSGNAADQLAGDLLGDSSEPSFAPELAAWLAGTPRFRAFAEANRAKIRKKLRTAADQEAQRDVRAELSVARLLLSDQRISLAFEAYGAGRRGPDLTVTYRGRPSLNLEVTRLRRVPDAAGLGSTLLAKLRQLPPSFPNALVVSIGGDSAAALDVVGATRALRLRADAKDEAFFVRAGFSDTRDFYQRYLRLGGVIAWCEDANGDARQELWTNASARMALPERATRAISEALRSGA
jgi:hypothetical protein